MEWAHAMAPEATIMLVEANSPSYSDMLAAVKYAARKHLCGFHRYCWLLLLVTFASHSL